MHTLPDPAASLLQRATNMDRALRTIAEAPMGFSVAALTALVFNIQTLAKEALKEVEADTNEQSESAA